MKFELGPAETDRLRLEPWGQPAHTEALAALNADPEVTRFLGGPVSRSASAAMSDRIAGHWEQHGFGLWAPVVKETGVVIGFVGLAHPKWHPAYANRVEVGWRLSRPAWGRGYASEAAARALEAGWAAGLTEILAFVAPANDRSIAVTARIGMELFEETTDPATGKPMLVFKREAA
jgi:RimJ/RimL family protein N-acetyltransferase